MTNTQIGTAIGILQIVKTKAMVIKNMVPSENMKQRAIKIYELAKELQDDLMR